MTTEYNKLSSDLKRLYRTSVKNARRRDITFTLTKEEFAAIAKRARDRCEVSGVTFDHSKHSDDKWARRPWAASLDRIAYIDGYNAKNCRLVCCAVNIALNTWGADVLRTVARAVLGLGEVEHPRMNGKLRGITRTQCGTFSVRASVGGKLRRIGTFKTEDEALAAYYKAKQDSPLISHSEELSV